MHDDLLTVFLHQYDRPNTVKSYRNDLVAFFESDAISIVQARSIQPSDVSSHLADLESRGYATASIHRRLASLRAFFDWCIALKLLEANPTHKRLIRRIRRESTQDRLLYVLTAAEANDLIAAAADHPVLGIRDATMILTMLHTVLRRSEVAAMNCDHLYPLGKYWVLDVPSAKGGVNQYVKVSESVVDAISQMQDHYGITSGPMWRRMRHGVSDHRISDQTVYGIVKRAALAAGLDAKIGAHTLRHTGCTLAIENGASLQQVQAHARHKQIDTTMNYVHQRNKLKDSAADFINLTPTPITTSKPPRSDERD